MKKVAGLLLVLTLTGAGLFAQALNSVEARKFDRVLEAEAREAGKKDAEKKFFVVGEDTQKKYDLSGVSKKIILDKTELDMGTYSLTFKVEDGNLVVSAKLHDGEEKFPSHFLSFESKFVSMADRRNFSGTMEYLQIYNVKMSLLDSKKVLVSTYTLGQAW